MKIIFEKDNKFEKLFQKIVDDKSINISNNIDKKVNKILNLVRFNGDKALVDLTNKYENIAGTTDGLSMEHVNSMISATKSHAGIRLDMPNNIQFIVEHTYISFVKKNDEEEFYEYPKSRKNETKIQFPGETNLINNLVIKTRIIPRPNILKPRSKWHTYANIYLKSLDLKIRNREKGDRFYPMGMKGDDSLQDFFVNQHIPRSFRDQVPLLTCENGIIWVTGHRLAEWAKVDDHSKKVSEFEIKIL